MKIHWFCLFVLSGVLLGEAQDMCGDFVKTLDDFTVQRYFLESDTGFENDLSCSWTLKAANPGSRLAYQLTDINLGSDDIINAYAGMSDSDTNVVSNHSGIGSSINVQSANSPNIHVTLQTGNVKQTTRQSFDAYYMAGSDQSGTVSCVNQTLVATAVPQFLTSPGFPDNYPTSKKCSWTITSPESATLELTFHMIDIEDGDAPTTCNYDGLVVYRPGQKNTPELLVCRRGVWVSETHPISINEIQLDFTSDDSDSFGGFVLSYKANLPPTTTTTTTTTTQAPSTEEITTGSSGCNYGSDGETTTSQSSDGEKNYDDQTTNSNESGSSDVNPSEGGLSVSITNGDVCQQPTVSGSCMAFFRRFTYDTVTKSCKEFIYGGCRGNDNRFDTLEQCQARCQDKPSVGTKIPPIEHYNSPGQGGKGDCYLPHETGPCRGFFRKYFYNVSSNACEQFTYGGCGGNANRFNTYRECETMCGDAVEADVCDKPLVTGPCRASFPKFGYDTASKACREFLYGGCHGNDNQFDSMQQCENKCIPKIESCDVMSCVIPIVVVIVLVIVAIIIAIVLVKKRQQSSKKYAPTSATEPGDPSEMKKMAQEPENV